MTTDEAVDLIRGPKGTPVTLTIFRDSWTSPKDIKIIRNTIKIPLIDWSIKNGDTAYIHIYQFNQTLLADFETVALEILQSPAKKIILDLRDNPGGYLEVAQQIAGWFLPSGQIVTIEDFGEGKQQDIYKTNGNSQLAGYPLVILINQGSASASEILSGALRDNRNIKLIGTKSFGKGCVQTPITMTGGSLLKVTVADWLTPKGGSITEVGLMPDVKVDITDDDILKEKDPQLDKALEIIDTLQ
jgi:carboxyl-terminal processing protease